MNFRSLSMQAAAFFVAVSFATTVSAAAWNLLDSLSINGSISVGPDLPEEDVVSELTHVEIAGVFEAALFQALLAVAYGVDAADAGAGSLRAVDVLEHLGPPDHDCQGQ